MSRSAPASAALGTTTTAPAAATPAARHFQDFAPRIASIPAATPFAAASRIEGAAPKSKAILSTHYALGRWDASVKLTYFGTLTLGTFSGESVPDQHYLPRTSVDLSGGYDLSNTWKLTLGGTNIFDALPSPQDPNETDTNFPYESVQMGFNGSAWFARLSGTFR